MANKKPTVGQTTRKVATTTQKNPDSKELEKLKAELVAKNQVIVKNNEEISKNNLEIAKLKAELEKANAPAMEVATPASVVSTVDGVEGNANVIALVEGILNIIDPVVKALADGKVSWMEGAGLALAISTNAGKVIKAAPEFWKEFKSLDPLDRAAVKAQFKEGFDIPDDEAEAKVEATFDLVVTIAPEIAQYVETIKS